MNTSQSRLCHVSSKCAFCLLPRTINSHQLASSFLIGHIAVSERFGLSQSGPIVSYMYIKTAANNFLCSAFNFCSNYIAAQSAVTCTVTWSNLKPTYDILSPSLNRTLFTIYMHFAIELFVIHTLIYKTGERCTVKSMSVIDWDLCLTKRTR